MEAQLLWMLIIQLVVLFFVAVSILLFMLKKMAGRARIPSDGSKSILMTGADTQIGMQIAKHLASLQFRVFAGVSDVNSKASYMLRSTGSPWLHILPLDVTNDDSLKLAIKAVREHSHAGEKGLWAVIHLAGTGVKSCKLQGGDDEQHLRTALEVTVVGMLRLIRACVPHLSAAAGRFIILGADDGMSLGLRVWGPGSIGVTHGVWTAARFAAEGLAAGLRAQLKPHGVPVISLHPDAYYTQRINEFPITLTEKSSWGFGNSEQQKDEKPVGGKTVEGLDHFHELLSPYAVRAVEDAILSTNPEQAYVLSPSASSRIKSMLIAFSPHCVTAKILKRQLAKPAYQTYAV